jgi:hypothetical protein
MSWFAASPKCQIALTLSRGSARLSPEARGQRLYVSNFVDA